MAYELEFEISLMKEALERDIYRSLSETEESLEPVPETTSSLSIPSPCRYHKFQNYIKFSIREWVKRETESGAIDLCQAVNLSCSTDSGEKVLVNKDPGQGWVILSSPSTFERWILFKKNFLDFLSIIVQELLTSDQTILIEKEADLSLKDLLAQPSTSVLARRITKDNPYDTRLKSLKALLSPQMSDWVFPKLFRLLGENLRDSDNEIFSLSLRICAKFASRICLIDAAIIFSILLEGLNFYYVHVAECPSMTTLIMYRMASLLKLAIEKFKLFMKHIFSCKKEVESLITKFINLLCLGVNKTTKMCNRFATPFVILSVIDPKSIWTQNLMYSAVTRTILIKVLMKHSLFIEMIVRRVLGWFENPIFSTRKDNHLQILDKDDVKFAVFFHSFSTFMNIFQYRLAYKMFPLKENELHGRSLKSVLDILVAIVNGFKRIDQKFEMKFSNRFITLVGNRMSLLIQDEIHFYIIFSKLLRLVRPNNPQCLYLNLLLGLLSEGKINLTFMASKSVIQQGKADGRTKSQLYSPDDRKILRYRELFLNGVHSLLKLIVNLLKETSFNFELAFKMFDLYNYFLSNCNIDWDSEDIIGLFRLAVRLCGTFECERKCHDIYSDVDFFKLYRRLVDFVFLCVQRPIIVQQLSPQDISVLVRLHCEAFQTPKYCWDSSFIKYLTFILSPLPGVISVFAQEKISFKNELTDLWALTEADAADDSKLDEEINELLSFVLCIAHNLEGVKAIFSEDNDENSLSTLMEWKFWKPINLCELVSYGAHNDDLCDYFLMCISLTALQIFVSSMDASLYLQNRLNYLESLPQIQSEYLNVDNGKVILDEFTILRQQIIEMSFGKRILTARDLYIPEDTKENVAWPKMSNELYEFMICEGHTYDANWFKQIRKLFKASGCINLKAPVLIVLLENLTKAQSSINNEERDLFTNTSNGVDITLSAEDILGIHQTIRYGFDSEMFSNPSDICYERLSSIVKMMYLSNGLKCEQFVGFDWFVATIFIIADSSVEETQRCLSLISYTPLASFLWFYNLRKNANASKFWQVLDELLVSEMPPIYFGLKNRGISTWVICKTWAKECFWKVMNWTQVCQWLIFALIYPTDYLLYFFLSILKYYEDTILNLIEKNEVWKFISIPDKSYNIHKCFTYMDRLHRKYHSSINEKLLLG